VRCGDRPGHLARLLTQVADQGGNIVDVAQWRQDPRLQLGEVEVALSVETRGSEHSDQLVTALRDAGYTVTFGV
jgi:threonine dehydratase